VTPFKHNSTLFTRPVESATGLCNSWLHYHIYFVRISESLIRLSSVARIHNCRTTALLVGCARNLRTTGAPLVMRCDTPTLLKAHYSSSNQSQWRSIICLEAHVSRDTQHILLRIRRRTVRQLPHSGVIFTLSCTLRMLAVGFSYCLSILNVLETQRLCILYRQRAIA
jgi:hypothetical protein